MILKKSGGGYVGILEAGSVRFFHPESREETAAIQSSWNDRLCIREDFRQAKADSRYVTLIEIERLCRFEPFFLTFANRQAWIVL